MFHTPRYAHTSARLLGSHAKCLVALTTPCSIFERGAIQISNLMPRVTLESGFFGSGLVPRNLFEHDRAWFVAQGSAFSDSHAAAFAKHGRQILEAVQKSGVACNHLDESSVSCWPAEQGCAYIRPSGVDGPYQPVTEKLSEGRVSLHHLCSIWSPCPCLPFLSFSFLGFSGFLRPSPHPSCSISPSA